MFEVTVSARFTATHQLRAPNGSLEPPHEHEWHVKVTIAGDRLDEGGLLVDFGLLRARLSGLLSTFDGRNLNAVSAFSERSPSAENVAVHVAEQFGDDLPAARRVKCVEVEERPGCVARYFPPENALP